MKKRVSGAWVGPATAPWAPLATLEADYATEAEADASYAPVAIGRRYKYVIPADVTQAADGTMKAFATAIKVEDVVVPSGLGVDVKAEVSWSTTDAVSNLVLFALFRDSTEIARVTCWTLGAAGSIQRLSFEYPDDPAAGTYDYELRALGDNTTTITVGGDSSPGNGFIRAVIVDPS